MCKPIRVSSQTELGTDQDNKTSETKLLQQSKQTRLRQNITKQSNSNLNNNANIINK